MDWTTFLTPGAPEISVLGETFYNDPRLAQYQAQYGSVNAAYQHMASERNADLLDFGQAIRGPNGPISVPAALQQLQDHGYSRGTDPVSVAQAYQLLMKAPPASPAPPTATSSAPVAGLNLGGLKLSPPLLLGGAVVLYVLMKRR